MNPQSGSSSTVLTRARARRAPARRGASRATCLCILAGALLGCADAEGVVLTQATTLRDEGGTTPTVAHDAFRGGSIVTWVETRGPESNVYLSRLDAEGRPVGRAVRVNSIPGDASTHEQAPPQAAVGPGGEIYVVWQKSSPVEGRRFAASDLRFAWSVDGGASFGPALTVNDDAAGPPSSHTFHNIAVADDGTVYVSWLDGREQDRARSELTGAGAAPPHGDHQHATHAQGRDGAAPDLPGPDIRVASWRPGDERFSPGTVVDGDVCPCCRTSLAVGSDGRVFVGWRKVFEGNVRDIVVSSSGDGGRSFTEPRRAHADGWVFDGCPHAGPSLAVDESGRLFVAWYTGREGRQGLYYAVSLDSGKEFGAPVPLLTDGWVPPALVSLAPAAGGGVWAAWDDRRTEVRQVRLGFLDDRSYRPIDRPMIGHSPAVAAGSGGGGLVWQDGATLRVRALRYPEN